MRKLYLLSKERLLGKDFYFTFLEALTSLCYEKLVSFSFSKYLSFKRQIFNKNWVQICKNYVALMKSILCDFGALLILLKIRCQKDHVACCCWNQTLLRAFEFEPWKSAITFSRFLIFMLWFSIFSSKFFCKIFIHDLNKVKESQIYWIFLKIIRWSRFLDFWQ